VSGDALPNDGGDDEDEEEEEEDEEEDEAMKLPAEREPDFPEEEARMLTYADVC
jgi:hypothetical protein